MDAIVQLVRNALCCVKDLGWFQESFPYIWDTNIIPRYFVIPEPHNRTTVLEAMIAVTQFYAFASTSSSGLMLVHTSLGKFRRIQRLIKLFQSKGDVNDDTNTDSKTNVSNDTSSDANRLLGASLMKERAYAQRSLFVGFLVMSIGIAFFWLFGNSLKVTETTLIGGSPGLIHALTVMEIALLPLLYYMLVDFFERLTKADQLNLLAKQIKELNDKKDVRDRRLHRVDIDLFSLEALTGFVPFWNAGVNMFFEKLTDSDEEEKLFLQEKFKIEASLDKIAGEKAKAKVNILSAKGDELTIAHDLQEKCDELIVQSRVTRFEGYIELVYFILNAVAFYGYMIGILVWYFDDEEKKPYFIRVIMMGSANELADWYGNFFGDLMWTIEPIIILFTPYIVAAMKQSAKKEKSKID